MRVFGGFFPSDLSRRRLHPLRHKHTSPVQIEQTGTDSHKHEVHHTQARKFWQRFPRNGGKARRAIARITKTNTPLGRGEGFDGPCANGMPVRVPGTRHRALREILAQLISETCYKEE